MPPNPVVFLFVPTDAPFSRALVARGHGGRVVPAEVQFESHTPALETYSIHLETVEPGRLTIEVSFLDPRTTVRATYTVDRAWKRPPRALEIRRVERKRYSWTCSYEDSLRVFLAPDDAIAYRLGWTIECSERTRLLGIAPIYVDDGSLDRFDWANPVRLDPPRAGCR